MEKQKISGNTEGIREAFLSEMEKWYDLEAAAGEYLPPELAQAMAAATAVLRREIAVFLSRQGEVLDIRLGDAAHVSSAPARVRRSQRGLNRIRLIHTHPNGNSALSEPDLSTLRAFAFDSVCAIGAGPAGQITGITAAFPDFDARGPVEPRIRECARLRDLPQDGWMEEIGLSDRAAVCTEPEEAGPEKVILVGTDTEASLDELSALAESAGAVEVGRFFQKRPPRERGMTIGRGKVEEIALAAQNLEAEAVIFDDELTGRQMRILEDALGLKVLDRTMLILDIFAQRARTNEGKLQVAAAQLKYRSTHLTGQGLLLSRLGGGIGTRGPGETKLEMDRRRIREQLNDINRRLEALGRERSLRRKNRERNAVPTAALVGYTNVGKSTLMNRMAGSDVLVKDMLFATLDSVSRRVEMKDGAVFVLVDTVGFINKLPHDLVEAFRSTLEEVSDADLLLIVSDATDDRLAEHRATVDKVLRDLGADTQPRIEVLNKCDLCREPEGILPGAVCVSASTGEGMDALLSAIRDRIREKERRYTVLIPYARYALAGGVRQSGRVISQEDGEDGTRFTLAMTAEEAGALSGRLGISLTEEP